LINGVKLTQSKPLAVLLGSGKTGGPDKTFGDTIALPPTDAILSLCMVCPELLNIEKQNCFTGGLAFSSQFI
jgi:hypothetical protein